jgi:hypothetical protein
MLQEYAKMTRTTGTRQHHYLDCMHREGVACSAILPCCFTAYG